MKYKNVQPGGGGGGALATALTSFVLFLATVVTSTCCLNYRPYGKPIITVKLNILFK